MTLKVAKERIEEQFYEDARKVLANEIFDAVKKYEVDAIWDVVYDAYDPLRYERREDEGGLLDPENIKGKVVNTTLTVRNRTRPNRYKNGYGGRLSTTPVESFIDEIVEYNIGDAYGYGYDWWHFSKKDFPRPFTKITAERLEKGYDKSGPNHVEAFINGMKKLGYSVVV